MYQDIITLIKEHPIAEFEHNMFGISFFSEDELEEFQVGYRFTSDGESLIGTKEGDWLGSWVVIGQDTLIGDPIFVDVSKKGYPVYKAMHGEGDWSSAYEISPSFEDFIQTLKEVKEVVNKENVAEEDIRKLYSDIKAKYPTHTDFWESWLIEPLEDED